MLNDSAMIAHRERPLRLLVLIPAHDEEANIVRLIRETKRNVQSLPADVKAEILVVDDCSGDRTAELASAEDVLTLRLSINLGYGGALRTGYTFAVRKGFDAVVQLDADGQHDPASIGALLEPIRQNEADVVLGSRWLSPRGYRMPLLRRAGQWFFRNAMRLLGGGKIGDATSGYQVLSSRVVGMFVSEEFPADYPDANVLLLLKLLGVRVVEKPAVFHERRDGRSMHSGLRQAVLYPLKMVFSMIAVALRVRFGLEKGFSQSPKQDNSRIGSC